MDFRICPRNNHLLLEQPQSNPNTNNVPQPIFSVIGIAVAAGILAIICLCLIYLSKCFPPRNDDSSNPNLPNSCSSDSSDCNNPSFTIVVYNAPIPPFQPSSSSSPSCVEPTFDQTTCSICLDEFKDGEELSVLPNCKHRYHKVCIEAWIPAKSCLCPVCRDKVMGKKIESSMPEFNQETVVGLSEPYLTGFGQTLSQL